MTFKKLSLVQPNFQQGPKEFNAHYLPYSVGVLWSYVSQFQEIKDYYSLDKIIWKRSSILPTAQSLADNDIIAFSTYVWNKNYNYALAREIKKINPNVLFIFGGPEIPITKKDIFYQYPFMDIVVKSEGEITLKNVLIALKNQMPLEKIAGLILNKDNLVIDTGDAGRIETLDEIPSPYLTGVFDKIMQETDNIEWNATLETNRGCPYACTFCDWGSLTYNKVKKFNLERVFDELEWIGKNKCGFVSITDANFGMFVERDNMIADKLLEVQEKYGYPYTFSVAWAKNQKAEVIDIVKKLIKSPKFNQGLTVSVQSMDLDVLENIKRKNLDQHKIEDIFNLCDKNNIPVYTEVILGLPGETLETWKEGFWKLFRAGNHTGITILHAQMLENAEMNLLQKKLFKIESRPVYDYMSGSYNFDELKECVDVVVSTKHMSTDEMLEAHAFSWFINTFHINGLTTYISRFMYKHKGIDFKEFYEDFYEYLKLNDWFEEERKQIKKYYRNWMFDGSISHPDISNIEVHGWNLVHRTTLNIHAENKYDYVFELVENFVNQKFSFLENEQLLDFQKHFVINYYKVKEYPIVKKYNYDFLGNLLEDLTLSTDTTYKFDFLESKDITIERFLENIYFSRRRNFGKSWVTKIN
jgi:hypothetical protein